MKEEINRVKVFQDVVGEWWLEFYANDVRHQVTIQDVINGLDGGESWGNLGKCTLCGKPWADCSCLRRH